jgi:hypothetical protein
MKQLDDFEKYMRDQLKGHIEPDPLMWKRLSDALGRVQPWYARSVFKYALTAFGSLLLGVITTYTYLEQKNDVVNKSSVRVSKHKTIGVAQQQQTASVKDVVNELHGNKSKHTEHYSVQNASITPVQKEIQNLDEIRDLLTIPATSNDLADGAVPADEAIQDLKPEMTLSPLVPQLIKQEFSSIKVRAAIIPNSSRISLSIATGQSFSKLPSFNYQLGTEGTQQAELLWQQNPLLQIQVHLHKNWHFNTGIQYLNSTINERFEQTKVFSYDEKEHYLFPYIYGFRQISDEELQEGPWPFGPNPPGGGDVSHIKANYQSVVRSQHLIVPVTIGYHKQFGVFEAQLHAGLGLHFAYRTNQTLHVPGYAPSTIYIKPPMGQFQVMAQSQLRMSYLANRHLAVFIEPQIRSAFQAQNQLHTLPYRNNTKAIYAGLSWKF